jgi:hypothetical protein
MTRGERNAARKSKMKKETEGKEQEESEEKELEDELHESNWERSMMNRRVTKKPGHKVNDKSICVLIPRTWVRFENNTGDSDWAERNQAQILTLVGFDYLVTNLLNIKEDAFNEELTNAPVLQIHERAVGLDDDMEDEDEERLDRAIASDGRLCWTPRPGHKGEFIGIPIAQGAGTAWSSKPNKEGHKEIQQVNQSREGPEWGFFIEIPCWSRKGPEWGFILASTCWSRKGPEWGFILARTCWSRKGPEWGFILARTCWSRKGPKWGFILSAACGGKESDTGGRLQLFGDNFGALEG